MKQLFLLLSISSIYSIANFAHAQSVQAGKEQIAAYSKEWKGERSADGRPRVSDDLVRRARSISLEEAWGVLRNEGYRNQFVGGWQIIRPDQPMAGRALTVTYMPSRPDMENPIKEQGKIEKRSGATNSWPIDMLTEGDIYIADGFGKIVDGTLIGDNLGNSIYAKSKNGVIFDGSVRDLEGLEAIEGFNGWVRGFDPSYIQGMVVSCINCPTRIGQATVLPGDLILAKKEGIVFIPAHLAEKVVVNSEFISLKDKFGHLRLRQGKYTPGEIDTAWNETIKADFLQWIKDNPKEVPMTKQQLDDFLKNRTW
ncbi:RraA family protein [Arundinibacter roseus]|uniref:RraA family protein n=1 Tax=Arundinibacter roseus TaxID=2070510 RepID=A0A4R4K5Q9_9BACT|nr:RraA family protein [Arundinibacter roseus]TDB61866.1 RraA family protein [Arundinibacter roseus]